MTKHSVSPMLQSTGLTIIKAMQNMTETCQLMNSVIGEEFTRQLKPSHGKGYLGCVLKISGGKLEVMEPFQLIKSLGAEETCTSASSLGSSTARSL